MVFPNSKTRLFKSNVIWAKTAQHWPFPYQQLQLVWLVTDWPVLITSVGWVDKVSRLKHKKRALTLTRHYETLQQPVRSENREVDWLMETIALFLSELTEDDRSWGHVEKKKRFLVILVLI